jgi:hypothetical protein
MHDQADGEQGLRPRQVVGKGNFEDMSLSQLLYAALVERVRQPELHNSSTESVEISTASALPSS